MALLLGALAGAACVAEPVKTITLTEADSTLEVQVNSRDDIEVRLESNPTTGYDWVLESRSLPGFLGVGEVRFIEPEKDLVGAPGTQVFMFSVEGKGSGILRFEYIRPFDDPPIPDKIVEYIILADGAEWPPADGTPPGTSTATAP